jgi:hypothetical protein
MSHTSRESLESAPHRTLNVGAKVGVGFLMEKPLFQINFFPDFVHVYFLPDAIEVIPALVQAPPALAAAFTGIEGNKIDMESIDKNAINLLFISRE